MIKNNDKFCLNKTSIIHIVTLFTLAVAHPFYDLITKEDHATFFIAHQSKAIDIYLLVFILSVLLPMAIFSLLWLLNLLSTRLARGLYVLVLLTLFALLFLPISERLLGGLEALNVGIATAASGGATLLFISMSWPRRFVSFMFVATILSPILFFTNPAMRSLLSSPEAQDYTIMLHAKKLPNIVMIIFDELPLTSLLDEDRLIDEVRYPNFARLAKTSHWYRNASSTAYSTGGGALPSLLTGWYPSNYFKNIPKKHSQIKGLIDRRRMPKSVFSLFENTHNIFSVESMTKLAPENQTLDDSIPPIKERIVFLSCDAFFVYSHLVAPASLKVKLPPINGQWADFCMPREKNTPVTIEWPYLGKKTDTIKQFIESFHKSHDPTFYFLHSLLPHFPFIYTATGKTHSNKFRVMTQDFRRPTGKNNWPNETIANLAYQAHLIQLSFADRLLGHVLDQLDRLELFAKSLIVVTADHGASFYWDSSDLATDKLRQLQASDTMYVPLFIKRPHQSQSTISDRLVETIDVLPTIADLLDVEIPWEIDGFSAFTDKAPMRNRIGMFGMKMEFGKDIEPDHLSLKRKIKLFGTRNREGLFAIGPHQEIVGKPISAFLTEESKEKVEFFKHARYPNNKPNGARVQAYVEGEITNELRILNPDNLQIAVAINGTIASTTTSTGMTISSLMPKKKLEADNKIHFLARIPRGHWRDTKNEISVHAIVENDRGHPVSLINFTHQP